MKFNLKKYRSRRMTKIVEVERRSWKVDQEFLFREISIINEFVDIVFVCFLKPRKMPGNFADGMHPI